MPHAPVCGRVTLQPVNQKDNLEGMVVHIDY